MKKPFIEFLDGLMMADADLMAAGAVEGRDDLLIRYEWAEPDDAFPYVVHLLELHPDPECWGVYVGTWTVDIWDYNANADRVLAIRQALIRLMERRFYSESAGSAFTGSRIWFQDDADLSDREERIRRESLRFGVRAIAKSDIEAIVQRDEVEGS
jgi:hypothetical protein